jgi:hypothetical protein
MGETLRRFTILGANARSGPLVFDEIAKKIAHSVITSNNIKNS